MFQLTRLVINHSKRVRRCGFLSDYLPRSFAASLPVRERGELLALGNVRRYARNQPLTRVGEQGHEAYLITDGCVKVYGDSADGRQVLLAVRMAGDLVGELAVLDGQPRSAAARAAGPVTVRAIGAAELAAYLAARPAAANAIRDSIAARLRESVQQRIEVNSGAPVIRRLARALCILGEQHGVAVADGVLIAAPLTQADLGSLIVTTEQSIRRALRWLRAAGLVRWEYRRTVITDPAGLREAATMTVPPSVTRRSA